MRPVKAIVLLTLNLSADDLEQTLLLVSLLTGREEHVGEVGSENFNVFLTVSFDSILCRHTACADRRVREDDSSNVVVAHLQVRSAVENTLDKNTSSLDSDGSQSKLVSDIANSVDAWNSGVLEFINLDGLSDDFNSSVGETKRLDIGRSSGSAKAQVTGDLLSISKFDSEGAIVVLDNFAMRSIKHDLDTELSHVFHKDINDVSVAESQDDGTDDQSDLDAKGSEDLGELNTDVSSSNDDGALRELLHGEEAI